MLGEEYRVNELLRLNFPTESIEFKTLSYAGGKRAPL
jgi:hypothetical protein